MVTSVDEALEGEGEGGVLKKLFPAVTICAALVGLVAPAGASPVNSWGFKAYGGFTQLHIGDFPDPGYEVLLTPKHAGDHKDMGVFHWSPLATPSLMGINQKEPLIKGQSWKAAGHYYGERNPVQPGIVSIHGNTIGQIVTNDNDTVMGEVIGWITHYNNWIPDAVGEARVALNYHLQLFDAGTDVPAWDSGEMFFVIDVLETANNSECCPDDNWQGVPPNQNGCADRFRVGELVDVDGNGMDTSDLEAAEVFASFNQEVGDFSYMGVDYKVYLTGFWEQDENGDPVQTGEGWSPETAYTHFEVRAEVWEADSSRVANAATAQSYGSCTPPSPLLAE